MLGAIGGGLLVVGTVQEAHYGSWGFLIAGLQGATGTLLIGLFGFVLGNRMRG